MIIWYIWSVNVSYYICKFQNEVFFLFTISDSSISFLLNEFFHDKDIDS